MRPDISPLLQRVFETRFRRNNRELCHSSERALEWWGDRAKSTLADESVSVDVAGSVKSAVTETLDGSEVTAGTLEIGTLPSRAVLWALIEENWLHHHVAPDDPRFPIMKARFRSAFVIDTDEWQRAVLGHGRDVTLQAIEGLVS